MALGGKRRAWWLVLAVLVAAGGLALWHSLRVPAHDFSAANLSRVGPGMTRAEVSRLLGVPPGSYCSGRAWPVPAIPNPGRYASTATWQDDEYALEVGLDGADQVAWACTFASGNRQRSLADRLRAWLSR